MGAWIRGVGLAMFLYASAAMSADLKQEFSFGAAPVTFASGASTIDLALGYHFAMFGWLQIGADLGYTSVSQDITSSNKFVFLPGMTANLGPMDTTFFIALRLAYRSGSSSVDGASVAQSAEKAGSGLGFALLFGKRFPVIDSFFFKPQFGFVAAGGSGFVFYPLYFSMGF